MAFRRLLFRSLNAAGVIGSALREHPNNADLWVGLGNALVLHADGMMTPADELAFQHAAAIAPDHPGPTFFYGLALAQGGEFYETEATWHNILATAPPGIGRAHVGTPVTNTHLVCC